MYYIATYKVGIRSLFDKIFDVDIDVGKNKDQS